MLISSYYWLTLCLLRGEWLVLLLFVLVLLLLFLLLLVILASKIASGQVFVTVPVLVFMLVLIFWEGKTFAFCAAFNDGATGLVLLAKR